MATSSKTSRKQDVANRMVELMAGFAPVQAKPMFGGHGIYWQGLMFALIAQERLYFKVDEQSLAAFTDRGLRPFTVGSRGKPIALKYHEAPDEVYDEPEHMARWARMGFDCALRQQKSVKGAVKVAGKTAKAPVNLKVAAAADGLSALQNLGPKSQEMLAKAGIRTEAQLRKLGPVLAYARTKALCKQASLNLLWALEGALSGRPWQAVAESERASLLMALEDVQRHLSTPGLAGAPVLERVAAKSKVQARRGRGS